MAKKQGDMSQIDRFGSGSIPKILLEFAVPAIAGMLVNYFYNIIDSIFLGHAVGELGLAASQVALPAMIIMMALSMLIGMGGNSIAAIKFGQGRSDEAERILGNCFTMFILMAIFVAVFGNLFLDQILAISGDTAESHEYSKAFVRILFFGFIFQSVGFGMNNFIRTAGAPNRALLTMVIGAVFCTIFNYILVIRLGWGVQGSALATIMGQAISAITVLQYFTSSKAPFKLKVCNMRLQRNIVKECLLLGLAPFGMQMAGAVVNIVFNNLLSMYGAQSIIGSAGALASMGVVMKVSMLAIQPVIGMSQAAQPLLGYNYGAQLYPRVRKALRTAMVWATIIIVVIWGIIQLFPEPIIGLFGVSDVNLLDFSVSAIRVSAIALPVIGSQVIGANYFQATGQPVKAAILALTRQLLYLIPLYLILPAVLPSAFGIDPLIAICIGMPVSDFLAWVTTMAFNIHEHFKMQKMEAAKESEASSLA